MQKDHTLWKNINYQPAVEVFHPETLLPYLNEKSNILEVGCGVGRVSIQLSEKGFKITGIDISNESIKQAKEKARSESLKDINFEVSDFLNFQTIERFNVLIFIRVLTCIPEIDDWKKVVAKTYEMLPVGGLVYVNDFVINPSSEVYSSRYEKGKANGWRWGNFSVLNDDGSLKFIAHHHTDEEIEHIKSKYETLSFKEHESTSMNGNPVKMFEFIGRK